MRGRIQFLCNLELTCYFCRLLHDHFSILGPQLCRLFCWVSDKHSQCSPGVSDSLLSSLLLLPLWAKGHGSSLTRFFWVGVHSVVSCPSDAARQHTKETRETRSWCAQSLLKIFLCLCSQSLRDQPPASVQLQRLSDGAARVDFAGTNKGAY